VPVKTTIPSRPGNAPSIALIRVPLRCSLAPGRLLEALSGEPMPFALTGRWGGGGAIVGSDPLAVAGERDDPFAVLDDLPSLPGGEHDSGHAVGGGWFGWLGYRLAARIERIPSGPPRPVPLPEFHLAYYDNVLRLDPAGQWWFEALVSDARRDALAVRLRRLRALVAAPPSPAPVRAGPAPLRLPGAAATHHLGAVRACCERIAAGEIFQANLCLRLDGRWDGSAAELLTRSLARISPPYAAAFDTPRGGIASLSPELFLRRRGARVTTAPIKGTITRDRDPIAAAAARERLRASAKDAAEHVMIVDLMRNDLGRVCAYGSILAPPQPRAEPHPGLWHLVSEVRGQLRPGVGNRDLLRATFPPGSVTGAPKVQALKVIAELERAGREVYTGAIGFASPVAGLELSVAIRTLEVCDGRLWLGAGGGIVADSEPERELEEALVKARPIAAAIGSSVLAGEPRNRLGAIPSGAPPAGKFRARTGMPSAPPDPSLGVFETLLVRDGRAQALDAHLARLRASVSDLYGLELPPALRWTVAQRGSALAGKHRLRIDAIPDGAGLRIGLQSTPLHLGGPPRLKLVCRPVVVPGGLGRHKWSDRRRLDELGDGRTVALLVDRDEEVLEAAWANFWLLEGSRLVTPPADGRLLPGVTRSLLLELAPSLGLEARQERISLARARAAGEIFLTSSLRLAAPATLASPPSTAASPSIIETIRTALSRLA
jgi:para-aminobenzoate synthetase/4-amino-4-deoxychorismate lyase